MTQLYALITGASKGIGKAMAECCGSYGFNMALVSLHNEGLEETAKELSERFRVRVRHLEIDLSLPESPGILRRWCEDESLEVNILINNAGIGYQGNFEEFDAAFYQRLLNTNVMAPALITREFIPMLKRQPRSWVLFSSSFAGFHPMPFKVVYAASKSFITQFSRGLFQELKNSGVHVTVVCPAGVDSFPESSLRINQIGWIARSGRLSPQQVASSALKGMLSGRRRIIPGKINILFYYVMKFLPSSFILRIMHHVLCKLHSPSSDKIQYNLVRQENPPDGRDANIGKPVEK